MVQWFDNTTEILYLHLRDSLNAIQIEIKDIFEE
jgi:hypothetical protein